MIDNFTIFSRSGVVLWTKSMVDLVGDPLNQLINNVLMEERSGKNVATIGEYELKWTLYNSLDLVFVCIYQKSFPLFYIDDLLESVKKVNLIRYAAASIKRLRFPLSHRPLSNALKTTSLFHGNDTIP